MAAKSCGKIWTRSGRVIGTRSPNSGEKKSHTRASPALSPFPRRFARCRCVCREMTAVGAD